MFQHYIKAVLPAKEIKSTSVKIFLNVHKLRHFGENSDTSKTVFIIEGQK